MPVSSICASSGRSQGVTLRIVNLNRHHKRKSASEIIDLKRDLKVAEDKITDQNTRLTSAESTWQMAENLYRQLADQVREHELRH